MKTKYVREMKMIASQLGNPTGKRGLEMADQMHESNISMTKNAISLLKATDTDRVLELGHGNAAHLPFLMEQAEGIHYTGLEISETMRNVAELNTGNSFHSRTQFEIYDGLIIPKEAGCFGKIFTVNTIYFWTDPAQLASELYRVLAPNGRLVIAFAPRSFMQELPFAEFGFRLYEKTDVVDLMEAAGFSLENTEDYFDQVKTKAGEDVKRPFSVISFCKK
ncbi:SAM-dependent methyltransferase [Algoriphagus sp. 4150]|uniref:class I SAM-dependent methyltransferase n=1 Tax=Algoriphagus sp. 4150 TaxID=2817756 RepID=UPI0028623254|nr:class I SAM-dependent methyltransferase [Algoriphagus sp. 4150]MDR7131449.1 SAM-dependent methyltransferase [Algoriphagus sp. 4150]